MDFGFGLGLALATTGLGFGLALTTTFSDASAGRVDLTTTVSELRGAGFDEDVTWVWEMTGAGRETLAGASGTEFCGGWSFLAISGSSSVFNS